MEDIDSSVDLDPPIPPVPGLLFRGFRGPEDYRLIADLLRAKALADCRDDDSTPESVARDLADSAGFAIRECLALAVADSSLAAYVRFHRRVESDNGLVYLIALNVLPAWRRGGADAALLGWAEAAVARMAEADRASGVLGSGAPAPCVAPAHSSDPSKIELLEDRGYRLVRVFATMRLPAARVSSIEAPPLPEGVSIRRAEACHYRAIWDADEEAFRDHWGHEAPSEDEYRLWLADEKAFRPELWKVAWDEASGEVAGSAWCHVIADKLFVDSLSVRRAWRRRGLGSALLALAAGQAPGLGVSEVRLNVDAENPSEAFRIYRDFGFEDVSTMPVYRKDLSIPSRGGTA